MRDNITIGLVTPQATNKVPAEGAQMYPGVVFVPKGVGVKALTPEGYDSAWWGRAGSCRVTGSCSRPPTRAGLPAVAVKAMLTSN